MAASFKFFQKGIVNLLKANLGDLSSAANAITVNLMAATYSPAQQTDASWAAISANEASGAGYSAQTLADKAITDSALVIYLDATDTTFTAVTLTWRYATLRKGDYLIGLYDPGELKVYAGTDCVISWNDTIKIGKFTVS